MLTKWSYSSLTTYEACPYRLALRAANAPLPPEDPDAPTTRGSNIHKLAEEHVQQGNTETPPELEKFKFEFYTLQDQFKLGLVAIEQPWYFDANWRPCDKDDAWLTMILDVFINHGDNSCKIIDHKTGRKFGNEIKHTMQGQLYTVGAFRKHQNLERAKFSFWYLDHGTTLDRTVNAPAARVIQDQYTKRAETMLNDPNLSPKPNKSTCKWCDYAKSKACEYRWEG